MLISLFILAFSSSIDSLGIGITYGIKNTKISCLSKIILFCISIGINFISICCGKFLNTLLSAGFANIIGNLILIFIGIIILFQTLKKDDANNIIQKNICTTSIWQEEKMYTFFIKFLGITIKIIKHTIYSDLDNSNKIEPKEALFLGIALSLDSFCIGIGGSILGVNYSIFPFLVAFFQLIFLSLGNFLGRKLYKLRKLPDNIYSSISGLLLIIIGLFRIFYQ